MGYEAVRSCAEHTLRKGWGVAREGRGEAGKMEWVGMRGYTGRAHGEERNGVASDAVCSCRFRLHPTIFCAPVYEGRERELGGSGGVGLRGDSCVEPGGVSSMGRVPVIENSVHNEGCVEWVILPGLVSTAGSKRDRSGSRAGLHVCSQRGQWRTERDNRIGPCLNVRSPPVEPSQEDVASLAFAAVHLRELADFTDGNRTYVARNNRESGYTAEDFYHAHSIKNLQYWCRGQDSITPLAWTLLEAPTRHESSFASFCAGGCQERCWCMPHVIREMDRACLSRNTSARAI